MSINIQSKRLICYSSPSLYVKGKKLSGGTVGAAIAVTFVYDSTFSIQKERIGPAFRES